MGKTGVPRSPETRAKQRAAALARYADPRERAAQAERTRRRWEQADGPYSNLHTKRGAEHHSWKGGEVMSAGYVHVYAPDHPRRRASSPYVARCRLVMEAVLGRLLEPGELVHHRNGIKTDDRPENLVVLTRSAHVAEHNRGKDRRRPRRA